MENPPGRAASHVADEPAGHSRLTSSSPGNGLGLIISIKFYYMHWIALNVRARAPFFLQFEAAPQR